MQSERAFVVNDAGRMVLLGSRRKATGGGIFPRVPGGSPAAGLYEDLELTGRAILYSYTVIHPNPKTGQRPFVLAIADYGQAARVFARLDCPPAAARIGMAVEARPTEAVEAGFVFVPAGES